MVHTTVFKGQLAHANFNISSLGHWALSMSKSNTVAALADASIALAELAEHDFARIRNAIGNARVVLIGEETHGTQEFYALRAAITRALIEKEKFSLVLCESDFPTFYKLHQYVGGTRASTESLASSSAGTSPTASGSSSASTSPVTSPPRPASAASAAAKSLELMSTEEVMDVLKARFPVWMWRNEVVRDFVEWLHRENAQREHQLFGSQALPVALFGLDIYSMFSSTDQVIAYLDAVDPAMAQRARQRYGVLQQFRPHEENYCLAVMAGAVQPQGNRIRKMLEDLDQKAPQYKSVFGDGDEYFSAHENARVVMAAEEYYRQSYMGGSLTWNIRDRAMADMIANALQFHDEKLQQLGSQDRARAVVWAHNSHIGDATATEQYERMGQVNVGHLVRQMVGKDDCFLIGLSTCTGSVRAANHWNGRDHVMKLNPSLPDSTGDLLHQVTVEREDLGRKFGLLFRSNDPNQPLTKAQEKARQVMQPKREERFVGVQYLRATERQSHYSLCKMSDQFDLVLHLDHTHALRPLPELAEPKLPPGIRVGPMEEED